MCNHHASLASVASVDPEAPGTAAVEAFGERLVEVLNDAALALAVSVGHRTRLFDALEQSPSCTSESLAAAAGLDERYVREWLGAMVTGGIVLHDAVAGTYELPAAHAPLLRSDSPQRVAHMFQFIAGLAGVEDGIVRCFREGGGLSYDAFPRFHAVMEEDSGLTVDNLLLEEVLGLEPELRRRLEAGAEVLDLGCGRGRALLRLAEAFPASRFTGVDFSAEATGWARERLAESGLDNLTFEVEDAARYRQPGRFDIVFTFDAIHDQARPDRVLANIRASLADDGIYLMQDIDASSHLGNNLDHPLGPFLYTVSFMHCMTVSLADGGLGLGTVWGREKATSMLAEAGFSRVAMHKLEEDVANQYFVARP